MFNTGNCYSLADIAAATGNGNGNNDGFMNGDGWWIILLFLFIGWGNNGNCGFGGGNGGQSARDAVTYGFDFNNLESGIRGIQQGLCDGFYAMNSSIKDCCCTTQNNLTQGFAGLNTAYLTGTNAIQQAINADTVAGMQNTNTIISQLCGMSADNAACCCETQRLIERSFADTNYNMATQACDTRRAIADTTRDIIENQNNNTRSILDFLVQDKLSTLQSENQALKFAASQAEQNAFITANQSAQTAELIRRLGAECPVPAYVVPNPNCCYDYTVVRNVNNGYCCNGGAF